MADKKKNKKLNIAKKVAPVKKKPVKKVDIVEEAKKELKKIEAEKIISKKTAKKGFAWITFISAVLLTSAAFILTNVVKETLQKKQINAFLPELVAGLAGGMNLENTSALTDVSGLYQFKIKFADYDEEFTSAITKDGKYFFVDMSYEVPKLLEEFRANGSATSASQATTCENVIKTDAPQLDIYVSSDCSHCNDLEMQAIAAIKQAPALAQYIKLNYVGGVNENGEALSLFGDTVAGEENLRQVCIREKSLDSFWNYLECKNNGGTAETCQVSAGVQAWAVNQCMTDGTGIAAVVADNDAATTNNVTGTPTLYINGTQLVSDMDFGGRIADAYKKIICCGMSTEADFCSQTLTEVSALYILF
jgi:hypothetical protein